MTGTSASGGMLVRSELDLQRHDPSHYTGVCSAWTLASRPCMQNAYAFGSTIHFLMFWANLSGTTLSNWAWICPEPAAIGVKLGVLKATRGHCAHIFFPASFVWKSECFWARSFVFVVEWPCVHSPWNYQSHIPVYYITRSFAGSHGSFYPCFHTSFHWTAKRNFVARLSFFVARGLKFVTSSCTQQPHQHLKGPKNQVSKVFQLCDFAWPTVKMETSTR